MENLITLDEYKLAKKLSKNDEDEQLEWLITSASSIIQTYLRRDFSDTGSNVTQIFNLDYDASVLFLDKYPVVDLISVTEINPWAYDSTVHFPTPTANYYLDAEWGRLIRLNNGYWPQGQAAVIVTYVPGYPGGISTVPPDLKQATIDLVTYYKNDEYKPSMQTRGATITNSVSGRGNPNDFSYNFPPHIQRILDMYK